MSYHMPNEGKSKSILMPSQDITLLLYPLIKQGYTLPHPNLLIVFLNKNNDDESEN